MVWSAFVTVAIFVVGFGQVLVLKSFFSEKKPSQMYGYHWCTKSRITQWQYEIQGPIWPLFMLVIYPSNYKQLINIECLNL